MLGALGILRAALLGLTARVDIENIMMWNDWKNMGSYFSSKDGYVHILLTGYVGLI